MQSNKARKLSDLIGLNLSNGLVTLDEHNHEEGTGRAPDLALVAGDYTRLSSQPIEYVDIPIQLGEDEIVNVKYPTRKPRSRFIMQTDEETGKQEFVENFEPPIDVAHLRDGRWAQGILSGRKDVLIDLAKGAAIEVPMFESHLVCSEAIPMGCYYADEHGIYRNELDADRDAQDSDGDRIAIHARTMEMGEAWDVIGRLQDRSAPELATLTYRLGTMSRLDRVTFAVANKFPTTDQDPPLIKLDRFPMERFYAMDEDKLAGLIRVEEAEHKAACTLEGEYKAFRKTHAPNETGLKTNELNMDGFLRMPALTDRGDRIRTLHVNPADPEQRRRVIEWDGLKGRSKDGVEARAVASKSEVTQLAYHQAWMFQPNAIGSLGPDALEWMEHIPISDAVEQTMQLDMQFRTIVPGKPRRRRARVYDRGLMGRLAKLGLIGYEEIPSVREGLPASLMLWLKRPGVGYCGLTSTRRGMTERTFCYLIPPVAIKVGEGDEAGWKIVSGRTALANRLAEFNCEIRDRWTRELITLFPQRVEDLGRYPGKRAALQKFIQEIAGIYGDACPARLRGGKLSPTAMARATVTRTVAIDYGSDDLSVDEMWSVAVKVNRITRICLSSGKGDNMRVRKFPFAHPNGVAVWADERDHARRTGSQRAQLVRVLEPRKYKVAFVFMETQTVPLITPSGIEKQLVTQDENMFLPRVSAEPAEGFDRREECYTWAGERLLSFVGSAREACQIGKLIDKHGMKFVPRASGVAQAYTKYEAEDGPETREPIDLIVPVAELAKKGCLRSMLDGAVRQNIWVNGQVVEAYVAERSFFRTGAASENIKPRQVLRRIKGADRLCVHAQMLRLYPNAGLPWPDLRYAQAKMAALSEIAALVGFSMDAGGEPDLD